MLTGFASSNLSILTNMSECLWSPADSQPCSHARSILVRNQPYFASPCLWPITVVFLSQLSALTWIVATANVPWCLRTQNHPVNHDIQTSTCVEIRACVVRHQLKTLILHEFLNFLLEVRAASLVRYNDFCNSPTIGHPGRPPSSSGSSTAIALSTGASKNALATSFTMMALVSSLNAQSGHFSTVAAFDTSNFRAFSGGGWEQSVHVAGVELHGHEPALVGRVPHVSLVDVVPPCPEHLQPSCLRLCPRHLLVHCLVMDVANFF